MAALDGKPIEPITEIKRIIVSPPDREELRKLPGLAINDPNWPGNAARMTDGVEDLGPLPYASRVEAMAGYGLSAA